MFQRSFQAAQKSVGHGITEILGYLIPYCTGLLQSQISDAEVCLIHPGEFNNLRFVLYKLRLIPKLPQVDYLIHSTRVTGIHNVGSSSIHHCNEIIRDNDGVKGIII